MTMNSVSDLITETVYKVEKVKEIRVELGTLIEEIREAQILLADAGINMDFPVLNETPMFVHQDPVPGTSERLQERVIISPITPPGPPPPTEDEMAGEEADIEEDISRPLPGTEIRGSGVLRDEAFSKEIPGDAAAFSQNVQNAAERAILKGFNDPPQIVEKY